MSSMAEQGKNLYANFSTNVPNDERIKDMMAIREDVIDTMVWAAAQQNALGKMELFTKMAKKINDQA